MSSKKHGDNPHTIPAGNRSRLPGAQDLPQGKAGKPQTKRADSAFQQHDPANRLGSFEGAGEHARTGNRGHQ
jgi:hypothetical protein